MYCSSILKTTNSSGELAVDKRQPWTEINYNDVRIKAPPPKKKRELKDSIIAVFRKWKLEKSKILVPFL